MMATLKGAALLVTTILLAGCIGYEEELWLNSDGSGRLHFEVSISEAVMVFATSSGQVPMAMSAEEFQSNLTKLKGFTVEETKTFSKAGNRVFSAKLKFQSVEAMKQAMGSSPQDMPPVFGTVQMTEDESGNVVLSRTVGGLQQMGEGISGDDAFGKGIEQAARAMLANYTWKYKVHFPSKVLRANTADSYIEKDTNTVTWEFSLASLMNAPGTMTATIENPVPWVFRLVTRLGIGVLAVLALGGLLGVGAVAAIAILWRLKKPV